MSRERLKDNRKVDRRVDPKPYSPRRIEVITGADTRRRWSEETKARIVAESFAEGAVVAQVARRHGLRPQQLFDWRRELRAQWRDASMAEAPAFVPAIAEDVVADAQPVAPTPPLAISAPPAIEIEAGLFVLRLRGTVDGRALATVLRAMKVAAS
jgi:transposase